MKSNAQQQILLLQSFLNDGRSPSSADQVRILGTADEPWFVATDVAKVLGISNSRDMTLALDDDDLRCGLTDTLGGKQTVVIISESGLYQCAFKSRKHKARLFAKWVTREVLPSLRRKGYYELEAKYESKIETIENSLNERVNEEIGHRIKSGLLRELTDQESVKISSRLVQLGHITQAQLNYVMETYTSDGWVSYRECRPTFISRIRGISIRLASGFYDFNEAKVKLNRSTPKARAPPTRSNSYTMYDYLSFGDNIINEYMREHPFLSWFKDSSELADLF
jgi:prophage antirepressor-like protein